MNMDEHSWGVVRNTPGVTGFVGSGNVPTPLEENEVGEILKQMTADTPKVKVGYRKGQSVRVTDGPFIDFVGVVDEINMEKGKLKVLLSLFGQETPVELDFLQVDKL
jgi:transcriptional antiterminator NusG